MKFDYCVACGSVDSLHEHHLVPRSLGGSDAETNLITLCGACHGRVHGIATEWCLSDLTKKAMQHKKAKGQRVGSIPYGYTLAANGVDLLENDSEQAIIKRVNELSRDGLNLSKIADYLNNSDYKPRGKKWYPQTIKNILAA